MYYDFFGFREPPFSIAPDPRYLYLSDRHKEALAHLMYGVSGHGGFIVITGEVGTGKTTVSRCFVDNVPEHVDMAIILNPRLSARELLSSICDELGIAHPAGSSIKKLVDLINKDLLEAHAAGRHKVLLIDEAQNLSSDVLEQLRLLTNLETAEKKLLQIILLGQPELIEMLARPELRQLNQRVTARYHLDSLTREELPSYLRYRLTVAGQRGEIFSPAAVKALFRLSSGTPRLINLISDRALLGAYSEGEHQVGVQHVRQAAKEVVGAPNRTNKKGTGWGLARVASVLVMLALIAGGAFLLKPDWLAGAGIVGVVDEPALPGTDKASTPSVPVEPESAPSAPEEMAPSVPSPEFSLSENTFSQTEAFRALFGLWGEDYVASNYPVACDYAQQRGLKCLYREGTRKSLERLNRPAVLQLQDEDGNTTFVTVASLDQGRVQLVQHDGEMLEVPFHSLDDYWYGDFTILWRLPPYLRDGAAGNTEQGEEIWLSSQLMQLAERYAGDAVERTEVLGMGYRDQIRWYQEKVGLSVDGIAGVMTLIRVNSDLNPGVPRLVPPLVTGGGLN
ncbi:ExeA family protein [Marinobacter zhejiangensis]|uniref:General secretion pathway protein A n=1 Tax=Marinobacter zhejiangensis TaxID=488535 RepID=A0A1I4RRN1_9GAMM|nr:AAA family ATPase [Marinobacter zhejiangensis]SFM54846.1 general secretion pathway protein A [Marinobacter zhejiangensis]